MKEGNLRKCIVLEVWLSLTPSARIQERLKNLGWADEIEIEGWNQIVRDSPILRDPKDLTERSAYCSLF